MNCYRVTFYNGALTRMVNDRPRVASETIWVDANNDHHAVAVAATLALSGKGNSTCSMIQTWLNNGLVTNVYSVIETN